MNNISMIDINEINLENVFKNIYKYNSDLSNNKMEYWNMHTYSNKIIEPSKIKLLQYQDDISAEKILKYLIENNFEYVKENCGLLYKYYYYSCENKVV